MSSPTFTASSTAAEPAHDLLLQRKCDCGSKSDSMQGDCEECQSKKSLGMQLKLAVGNSNDPMELEADQAAAAVMNRKRNLPSQPDHADGPLVQRRSTAAAKTATRPAPKSVTRTLQNPGRSLPERARAFFEPRFGYDFSRVRIHDDAQSAASAQAVRAHAYTVGNHLVFNNGRYNPDSAAGKTLLAHELAHVIQQDSLLRREAVSAEPESRSNHEELNDDQADPDQEMQVAPQTEESAERFAGMVQRQADSEPWDLPSGGWDEKDEAAEIRAEAEAQRACIAATPPDPVECDPGRNLNWADFTGRAPRNRRYGAVTYSSLRERAVNTALLRCMPDSAAAQAATSARALQAFFDPARSGVRARYANASDPAVNGCASTIGNCQRYFDRLARRNETGQWWMTAGTNCPAGIAPRGDKASSRAECATVVASDCNDRAVAESARLLNHEQVHFDLTCAMARKANAMITTETDIAALLRGARSALSRQQRLYDNQSNHGCIAAQQSAWEAAIAAGLPSVNITVRSGRRRGRQRRSGSRGQR